MKEFSELTTIERAGLLHRLFPGEVRGFLTFLQEYSDTMLNRPDDFGELWPGRMPSDNTLFIAIAKDIQQCLSADAHKMEEYRARFAHRLFEGVTALFTIQCLKDYSTVCENKHWNITADLFFGS